MIALGLAFAVIGMEPVGAWLIGRSRGFRQKALLYSGLRGASRDAIESDRRWVGILRKKAEDTSDRAWAARWLQRAEEFRHDVVTDQRLRDYYGRMRRKYERPSPTLGSPSSPTLPRRNEFRRAQGK